MEISEEGIPSLVPLVNMSFSSSDTDDDRQETSDNVAAAESEEESEGAEHFERNARSRTAPSAAGKPPKSPSVSQKRRGIYATSPSAKSKRSEDADDYDIHSERSWADGSLESSSSVGFYGGQTAADGSLSLSPERGRSESWEEIDAPGGSSILRRKQKSRLRRESPSKRPGSSRRRKTSPHQRTRHTPQSSEDGAFEDEAEFRTVDSEELEELEKRKAEKRAGNNGVEDEEDEAEEEKEERAVKANLADRMESSRQDVRSKGGAQQLPSEARRIAAEMEAGTGSLRIAALRESPSGWEVDDDDEVFPASGIIFPKGNETRETVQRGMQAALRDTGARDRPDPGFGDSSDFEEKKRAIIQLLAEKEWRMGEGRPVRGEFEEEEGDDALVSRKDSQLPPLADLMRVKLDEVHAKFERHMERLQRKVDEAYIIALGERKKRWSIERKAKNMGKELARTYHRVLSALNESAASSGHRASSPPFQRIHNALMNMEQVIPTQKDTTEAASEEETLFVSILEHRPVGTLADSPPSPKAISDALVDEVVERIEEMDNRCEEWRERYEQLLSETERKEREWNRERESLRRELRAVKERSQSEEAQSPSVAAVKAEATRLNLAISGYKEKLASLKQRNEEFERLMQDKEEELENARFELKETKKTLQKLLQEEEEASAEALSAVSWAAARTLFCIRRLLDNVVESVETEMLRRDYSVDYETGIAVNSEQDAAEAGLTDEEMLDNEALNEPSGYYEEEALIEEAVDERDVERIVECLRVSGSFSMKTIRGLSRELQRLGRLLETKRERPSEIATVAVPVSASEFQRSSTSSVPAEDVAERETENLENETQKTPQSGVASQSDSRHPNGSSTLSSLVSQLGIDDIDQNREIEPTKGSNSKPSRENKKAGSSSLPDVVEGSGSWSGNELLSPSDVFFATEDDFRPSSATGRSLTMNQRRKDALSRDGGELQERSSEPLSLSHLNLTVDVSHSVRGQGTVDAVMRTFPGAVRSSHNAVSLGQLRRELGDVRRSCAQINVILRQVADKVRKVEHSLRDDSPLLWSVYKEDVTRAVTQLQSRLRIGRGNPESQRSAPLRIGSTAELRKLWEMAKQAGSRMPRDFDATIPLRLEEDEASLPQRKGSEEIAKNRIDATIEVAGVLQNARSQLLRRSRTLRSVLEALEAVRDAAENGATAVGLRSTADLTLHKREIDSTQAAPLSATIQGPVDVDRELRKRAWAESEVASVEAESLKKRLGKEGRMAVELAIVIEKLYSVCESSARDLEL